jgi:hypothetical protein
MPLRELTPEMRWYFEKFYPTRKKADFAQMFSKYFGHEMTVPSAKYWAGRIGIAGETPSEYMTLMEIAGITGEPHRTIIQKVTSGRLKAVKTGAFWLVPLAEAEKHIEEMLQVPPWDFITAPEAERLLGYKPQSIGERAWRGNIPAMLRSVDGKSCWIIPRRLIEMAHDRMRRTGCIRTPWRKLIKEWQGENGI